MIQETIQQVREGFLNPLDAYIELKRFEKEVKEAITLINDEAIDEALKYEQKNFNYKGAKITVKSNAGTWGFDHIPQWNSAKDALQNVEELAKQAYKAKGKEMNVVTGEGEVVEPAKFTEGKTNISVTLTTSAESVDPLETVFDK